MEAGEEDTRRNKKGNTRGAGENLVEERRRVCAARLVQPKLFCHRWHRQSDSRDSKRMPNPSFLIACRLRALSGCGREGTHARLVKETLFHSTSFNGPTNGRETGGTHFAYI
jgi:hypothetical protein